MVDVARVSALLVRIRTEVAALRALVGATNDSLSEDPNALPAAKYRLIVAVEAATDAAEHVIASEELRPATSFADTFRSLEEAGWLGSDTASHLSDAARFRNLLVHQYADVDDARVLDIIRDRLGDLEAFAEELATHLP